VKVICQLLLIVKVNLRFFIVLDNTVGIEHASILHIFNIGSWCGLLKYKHKTMDIYIINLYN